MRTTTILLSLLICCGITACSSGGGGPVIDDEDYVELVLNKGNESSDAFESYQYEVPAMPTRGSATYSGSAYIYKIQGRQLFGVSKLTADFAEDEISGRMDGFSKLNGELVDGHIDLAQGNITGRALDANLSGKLGEAVLSGKLEGSFYGTNANVVDGTFNGKAGEESIQGTFTAQR